MSALSGLPEGAPFHSAITNRTDLDNRIPPRGFTNAGFASVQASPAGYSYADGQHWDDTLYAIPAGATKAVVTFYHQTTTKEYAEFLRDANVTDQRGQVAYNLWVQFGRSAPVDMDRLRATSWWAVVRSSSSEIQRASSRGSCTRRKVPPQGRPKTRLCTPWRH